MSLGAPGGSPQDPRFGLGGPVTNGTVLDFLSLPGRLSAAELRLFDDLRVGGVVGHPASG